MTDWQQLGGSLDELEVRCKKVGDHQALRSLANYANLLEARMVKVAVNDKNRHVEIDGDE